MSEYNNIKNKTFDRIHGTTSRYFKLGKKGILLHSDSDLDLYLGNTKLTVGGDGLVKLKLPTRDGTIALTTDVPDFGFDSDLLDIEFLNDTNSVEKPTIKVNPKTEDPEEGSGFFYRKPGDGSPLIYTGGLDVETINGITLNSKNIDGIKISFENYNTEKMEEFLIASDMHLKFRDISDKGILYYDNNDGIIKSQDIINTDHGGTGVGTGKELVKNRVFASHFENDGSLPTFRELVADDIPEELNTIHVKGDLIVDGKHIVKQSGTLSTKDDMIFLRGGAELGLSNDEYAGLVITNYSNKAEGDDQENLGIVVDNQGTAYLGKVDVEEEVNGDTSGRITGGNLKPLVTRELERSNDDGAIMIWSDEDNSIIPLRKPGSEKMRKPRSEKNDYLSYNSISFEVDKGETGFHFNTATVNEDGTQMKLENLDSVSFDLNQKEDLTYTLVNNNKMFSSVEIDNDKQIINATERQDSLKFKSSNPIDVTGNPSDNTISFNLNANYGDEVNPYGEKGTSTVLISPLDINGNPIDGKPEFRRLINADLPDKNHTTGRFSSFSMDSKGTVTGGRHVIVSSPEQPGNPLIADGLWVNESDGNLVKIKKSNESEYTFEDLTVENAKKVLEKLIFTTLDGKVEFDGSDEKEVHLLSYPEVVDESKEEDSALNAKTMSHGSGDEYKQVDAEHLLDYTNLTQKPTKIGHIYGNIDGESLSVNDTEARQDLVRIIEAFDKYGASSPEINEGLITKELYENIMTLFEIVVDDQDENNIIDRLQEVYEFLDGHKDDETLVSLLNAIDEDITTLNTKVDTGIDRLDGLITNLDNTTVKLSGDQRVYGAKRFDDLRLRGLAGLRFLDEDDVSTVLARIVTNAGKLEITDSAKNGEIAVMSDVPTKTSDLDNDSDFTTKLYVDSLNSAMSGDLTGVEGRVTEIEGNYVSKSTFEDKSLDGIKELTGNNYLETSSDIHLNGSNILLTGEDQKVEFTVDGNKVKYYGRHIDLGDDKTVEYQDLNGNTSIILDGKATVLTDADITNADIGTWNTAHSWGDHKDGLYAKESKRLEDENTRIQEVQRLDGLVSNLKETKQNIHARITSFLKMNETGFIRLKNVEGNEIEIDKTDYLSLSAANSDFVKKVHEIAGIEIQEGITEEKLRTALNEATTSSKGLMSKEDKAHLNSIVEMFYDDGTGNSVIDRIQQVLDLLENFEEGNTLIDILSTKENLIKAGTNISFSETDGNKTISAVDTITKIGTDTLTSGDFRFKVDNNTVSGKNIVSISESKNGDVNEITVTVDPEHHSTVAIENDENEDNQDTISLKHGESFTIIENLKRDNNGHIVKQDRRNISLANLSTDRDTSGDSYGPVVSVTIDPQDPNKIIYKKSDIYLDTTTVYNKNLVYASHGQDNANTASFRQLVPGDLPSEIPISKIQNLQTALDDKVVKVTDKGLSTNDFTNDYRDQLDNTVPNTRTINGYKLNDDIVLNLDKISDGSERRLSDYALDDNVVKLTGDQTIAGIKTFTGNSLNISSGVNTISIQPDSDHSVINSVKTFLMGNDIIVDGEVYVGNSQDNKLVTESFVQVKLDNKVDKDGNKGLSTNDFTNDYKTKLDNAVPNTRTIAGHSLVNDISVDSLMDSIGVARKIDTVYVRGLLSAEDKEIIDDMAVMFYEDTGGILDKIQDIIDLFDGLDTDDSVIDLLSNKVDKDTVASSDTLGLVKTGYVTDGKKYKLDVDLNGNAFVDVPWINTTYTGGNNITINGTEISATDTKYTAGTNVSIVGTTISATDTTYNKMTSSILGLGKLASPTVQSVLMNSVSSTSERTYGIQANSSDQLVVNVPWTDTTYTPGVNVSINGTEISATDTTYTEGENVSIDGTTISATDTTYTAGENVQISESNVISANDTKYNLASSSTSGLVKLGYTTNNSSRNYKLDTDGSNMYVNVPWTDTKYTEGENVTFSGTTINATDTTYDNNTSDDIIDKSTVGKLISGSVLRSQFYLKSEAESTIDDKIEAAMVSAMDYMGSKNSVSDLPSSGNSKGDFWNVIDTGFNYAWNGSSWDQISGLTDLSDYAKKTDYTPITLHNQLVSEVNEKVSKTGNEDINGVKTFKETVEADKGIKIKESRIEFNETTRSIDFIFA